MRTPTPVPFDSSAHWIQYGRSGTGPRTMPHGFTTWDDEVERLLELPGKYIIKSECPGADGKEPGPYRMHEFLTWYWGTSSNERAAFIAMLYKLRDAGKVPVIYIACPRYDIDEHVVRFLFDFLPSWVQIALDAASGQGQDSLCYRTIMDNGGPDRFWIEAHPWDDKPHWEGFNVVCLGRHRKSVEYEREHKQDWLKTHDTYPHGNPIDDDKLSMIVVAMTGHKDRWNDVPNRRDARLWNQAGLVVATQPHEQEKFKGTLEVGK